MPEYRPWTDRRFGVEMEMTTSNRDGGRLEQRALIRALADADCGYVSSDTGYRHSHGESWDVKTDSSCGWEVASPILWLDETGHSEPLRRACEAINRLRPKVTRECGLHVHMALPEYTWDHLRQLLMFWSRYEPFYFEMLPSHRRNNGYCSPLVGSSWERSRANSVRPGLVSARSERSFNDYARATGRGAINLAHWWRTQRVEFRLHSGTTQYDKIRYWVMLLAATVRRVSNDAMPPLPSVVEWGDGQGFDTYYVFKMLGLVPSRHVPEVAPEARELFRYVDRRRAELSPGCLRRHDENGRRVRSEPTATRRSVQRPVRRGAGVAGRESGGLTDFQRAIRRLESQNRLVRGVHAERYRMRGAEEVLDEHGHWREASGRERRYAESVAWPVNDFMRLARMLGGHSYGLASNESMQQAVEYIDLMGDRGADALRRQQVLSARFERVMAETDTRPLVSWATELQATREVVAGVTPPESLFVPVHGTSRTPDPRVGQVNALMEQMSRVGVSVATAEEELDALVAEMDRVSRRDAVVRRRRREVEVAAREFRVQGPAMAARMTGAMEAALVEMVRIAGRDGRNEVLELMASASPLHVLYEPSTQEWTLEIDGVEVGRCR